MRLGNHLLSVVTGIAIFAATAVMAGPGGSKGAKVPKDPGASEDSDKDSKLRPLTPKVLSELQLEHSRTRDELSAVESRLNLLSKKLYNSQILVDYRGELDKPFNLQSIALYLDGAPCYSKTFKRAPTVQALRLLEMYLPPGRHVVELRVRVSGPDDADDALPGYFSGSSISAHLRPGSTTKVVFKVEQDGDPPSAEDLRQNEVESEWNVEISADSVTEKND